MKKNSAEEAIRTYLAGKHSPQGEALFNEWYDSFEDEATIDGSDEEKRLLAKKMLTRIEQKKHREVSQPLWLLSHRVAASFVGLLMMALVILWYYNQNNQLQTVSTGHAQLREVMLPDGSIVALNANSKLRYGTDWNTKNAREVWLEGEAFFSVTHTSDNQKFIVRAGDMDVAVLGTEFNVLARREDVSVVLQTGKVKATVPHLNKSISMQPGDQVAYSTSTATITQQRTDPASHIAWRERKLVLNNTSLAEITQLLEDFYGYQVILANPEIGEQRLSSTSTLSLENPKVLIAAVAEIFSLKATQKSDTIYLERK